MKKLNNSLPVKKLIVHTPYNQKSREKGIFYPLPRLKISFVYSLYPLGQKTP